MRKVAQAGFRKRSQAIGKTNFNGLIYGDYGVGKTYLAGTIDLVVQEMNELEPIKLQLPPGINAFYRTLYINAEMGEDGLPSNCPDIVIKDIFDYKGFSACYEFLKLHLKFYRAGDVNSLIQLQNSFFQAPIEDIGELFIFQAAIVDSLTEVQKFCLYQLMGLSLDSKLDETPEYMQMRDWGSALEMTLLMIRNFRALPMYKVFIVQQMEDQDEKKKMFFRPALQGQARTSILGFFDFAGYLALQVNPQDTSKLRRLFLVPVGPFKAKNRFEHFQGSYLDNCTLADVAKLRIAAETPQKAQVSGRAGVTKK